MHETIVLTREVEAIAIPYGDKTMLPAGAEVTVHQVLGGNYTVMTDRGSLVRVSAKDSDALGKKAEGPAPSKTGTIPPANVDKETVEKQVWEQLRTCYDPEIPVNIVELGLVYVCEVTPFPAGGFRVDIHMTLTAPGCGMGPVLQADAKGKIEAIPGVVESNVEVVFEPPWDQSRMTEAARLQLGFM